MKAFLYMFLFLIGFTSKSASADASCAEIAREMSRCISGDLNNGRPCKDDTVLPERCRNTSDVIQGMKQGYEDAEKARKRDEREYFERE